MAQIFGYLQTGSQNSVRSILPEMAARMQRPTQAVAEMGYGPGDRGGLGALTSKEFGALAKVDDPEGPWLVALDGRLTNPELSGGHWARELVKQLKKVGPQSLRGLHGSFALAF